MTLILLHFLSYSVVGADFIVLLYINRRKVQRDRGYHKYILSKLQLYWTDLTLHDSIQNF